MTLVASRWVLLRPARGAARQPVSSADPIGSAVAAGIAVGFGARPPAQSARLTARRASDNAFSRGTPGATFEALLSLVHNHPTDEIAAADRRKAARRHRRQRRGRDRLARDRRALSTIAAGISQPRGGTCPPPSFRARIDCRPVVRRSVGLRQSADGRKGVGGDRRSGAGGGCISRYLALVPRSRGGVGYRGIVVRGARAIRQRRRHSCTCGENTGTAAAYRKAATGGGCDCASSALGLAAAGGKAAAIGLSRRLPPCSRDLSLPATKRLRRRIRGRDRFSW